MKFADLKDGDTFIFPRGKYPTVVHEKTPEGRAAAPSTLHPGETIDIGPVSPDTRVEKVGR